MPTTPARKLLLMCAAATVAAAVLAPSASAALPDDGGAAPPPAPAPSVRLHTVGLGSRDISLTTSSTRTQVTLQPGDAFTAYATSTTTGATVRLRESVSYTCQRGDGDEDAVGVIEQPLYADTGWVASPASRGFNVSAYPWNSCGAGYFLESVSIAVSAEARTATARSATPEAVFTYSPWRLVADTTVDVPESTGCCNDGWRSAGLLIQRDDRLQITGSGAIWAGVWFTGQNGPEGWSGTSAPPAYPLPTARKYGLIANLGDGTNGPTFHVGNRLSAIPSMTWPAVGWPWFYLNLRTNDDVPGNGSGGFNAHIRVWRHN